MISQKLRPVVILLLTVSIINTHCQPNKGNDEFTEWVKMNEENLYRDLLDHVLADTFNIPEYKGLKKVFVTSDTATSLGKFAQLVKKSSDGIEVRNIYTITNKPDSPELKMLLTVDFNKKYAKALDSLLNGPIQLKHFTVEKYIQPGVEPSIFIFPEGEIKYDNIRMEILKRKSPFVVVIYIKGKKNIPLLKAIQNHLHQHLLGEELLVKQVDSVRYEFVDSLSPHLLSVNDARSFLRSP
jgi:hypothetical protein